MLGPRARLLQSMSGVKKNPASKEKKGEENLPVERVVVLILSIYVVGSVAVGPVCA